MYTGLYVGRTSSVACVGKTRAATSTTTTAAMVFASTRVPARYHTCVRHSKDLTIKVRIFIKEFTCTLDGQALETTMCQVCACRNDTLTNGAAPKLWRLSEF